MDTKERKQFTKDINYKSSPVNKEHAFAIQLGDSVKTLRACSMDKQSFKYQLNIIQSFINIYNASEK